MKSSAGFPRRIHHRLNPTVYLGGLWHITICSYRRQEIFSVIEDGLVRTLQIGAIIAEELLATPRKRPGVILDEWVVMPNHVHAIVYIPPPRASLPEDVRFKRIRRSLSSLVAGLKAAVTSRVRDLFRDPAFEVWQDGYWDRGIRDEEDLERSREYIRNNPAEWEHDPERPS